MLSWLAVIGALVAAGAALWQLNLQRIQLTDQTRLQERKQANRIDVSATQIDGAQARVLPPDKDEPVHMVVVTNNSKRPIRDVTCKARGQYPDGTVTPQKLADNCGEMMIYGIGQSMREAFSPRAGGASMVVLRADRAVGFVWGLPVLQYPAFQLWVRFTDDAGLHWEIDTVLHLQKLARRDW
jgi:hypothetical protein